MKIGVLVAICLIPSFTISVLAQEVIEEQQNNESWNWLENNINIIAGIATAGAFVFLGYQTMMLRSEKNQTNRAWVGELSPQLEILSYVNEQGEEKTHEELKLMRDKGEPGFNWTKIHHSIEVKNYGTITAVDMKMRSHFSSGRKPDKKEILDLKYGPGASLLPNSTHLLIFTFTKKMEESIANPDIETYFLFEINYKSVNSKKTRKKGMLMRLYQTRYTVFDNWDENTKF